MKTIEYDISTGFKQDFYTLWKTITVDLRPIDNQGNILEQFRINANGGNMYFHVHIKFVQNLGKTKEAAKAKVSEMGLNIKDEEFELDLKHYTKPSFEAFGVKMKFKKEKWYSKATNEFFECWKSNKDEMKKNGWGCWKYENEWYMAVKPI